MDKKALRWRVAAWWYRIVQSGDERHLRAGTSVETIRNLRGGARYAVKYAQKMYQKLVPPDYRNVGRFWGHTRDVKPQPVRSLRCTEDDVRGVIEGWQYAPTDDRPLYRVLYNVATMFKETQGIELDRETVLGYNPVEPDSEDN